MKPGIWKVIAGGAIASVVIYGVSAVLTQQFHWLVALLFLALVDVVFAITASAFALGHVPVVKSQEVYGMQLASAIIGIPILLAMFSVGWLLVQFVLALKGMV